MHEELRKFLEANGLDPAATEEQAWEHHRKLAVEGVAFNGQLFAVGERETAGDVETREEPAPLPEGPKAATIDDARRMVDEAMRKERERAAEIRGLCANSGIPAEQERQWLEAGTDVDEVRKLVLAYMFARSQPFGAAATTSRASVGMEDGEKFRAAAVDGIMMQVGVRKDKAAPGASDFRGMSPMGMARLCLERGGVNTSMMDNYEIAKRALIPHSTSDFPTLLGGIGKESLLRGYQEASVQRWREFAETTTANDFRDIYGYDLVGTFDLKLVRENAEYETVDAGEAKQRYRMKKYGRIFPYTIEMQLNDRWDVFARVPRKFGAAANRLENDLVFGLFTGNEALLDDGKPLFDPSRGNVMTGSALDADSLKEAIYLLQSQRGPAGEQLDLEPGFLIVSPRDWFTATVLLNSSGNLGANLNAGVINPFQGVARPVSDPRIADGSWYLVANPSQAELLQVATLPGRESVEIEDRIDFRTDGIEIKARHIFGAGLMGWIGAIYNPGA